MPPRPHILSGIGVFVLMSRSGRVGNPSNNKIMIIKKTTTTIIIIFVEQLMYLYQVNKCLTLIPHRIRWGRC